MIIDIITKSNLKYNYFIWDLLLVYDNVNRLTNLGKPSISIAFSNESLRSEDHPVILTNLHALGKYYNEQQNVEIE